MNAPHKKIFYSAAACVLFVSATAIGFLLNEIYEGRYNLPEEPMVSADTQPQKPRSFQWEERYELCELYALDCKAVTKPGDEATETMLKDLSLGELASRYPTPDWIVTENEDNVVTICRMIHGLCEVHQKVYHLGINESGQYLAVYFGPSAVGNAAGAFLVTDVLADRLSPEQRMDLDAGVYEFYSQDDLIATLDNFSEL